MRAQVLKFSRKWLVPPAIWKAFLASKPDDRTMASKTDSELIQLGTVLTDGWADFRSQIAHAKIYAEYGSGESTLFVAANTSAKIRSIETDSRWVSRVKSSLSRPGEIVHIDLGPVGRWGRPDSYSHADDFDRYLNAPFAGTYDPDFVLIDGRFRVACFLTSLKFLSPGARIVLDDYVNRGYYHVVESILAPDFVGSRQAFFTRPRTIPGRRVDDLLANFRYVMD